MQLKKCVWRSGVYKFNLGTGTGATVLEVIKAFSEVVGKNIPYIIAGRRKGDVDSLYASCDLAEKVEQSWWTQTKWMVWAINVSGVELEGNKKPDRHVSWYVELAD